MQLYQEQKTTGQGSNIQNCSPVRYCSVTKKSDNKIHHFAKFITKKV